MLNDFSYLFPVVLAGTAMIMDLRTAKVDNGWILFSMFVGFVLCIRERGVSGIRFFPYGKRSSVVSGCSVCFWNAGSW